MKTLFDHRREKAAREEAPLAARMRPRTLDEYVGQDAIIGPGRLLRRAIQADQLGSLIFYGPPGTGKTTLARVIANTTKAEFIALNAVLSGVKDIRVAIDRAQEIRGQFGRRTILFVDEVHRFNKAQQDALLPWVENGTVILVGATTENPYFEVNKALVSRSRIFQLQPLTDDDLRRVAAMALSDPERGFGDRTVEAVSDALDHLVDVANGDARALLNALELAVSTTPPGDDGVIRLTLEVAEESIQQRAVLYDKEGDAHFDAISAFIKSCRGSDPDAALYWLARMVHAGEEPRFLFRRMIILASEDVGLADPDVLVRVEACAAAYDRIGLPEGRYHLAQAALVLATAPKSNSTMGFFEALRSVAEERSGDVPDHLKDASRDGEQFGHGQGYLYPHAYRDHWVAQQYLPSGLEGKVFYTPSDQGFEAGIAEQVARRREAQLAAFEGSDPEPLGLTSGPEDAAVSRWVRRATAGEGARLGALRDRVFEAAGCKRHHLVLDLRARTGLLTWEALRRVPEGGVHACVSEPDAQAAATLFASLRAQVEALPALARPTIFAAPLLNLGPALAREAGGVRFDRVVGHAVFDGRDGAFSSVAKALAAALPAGARVVLAEPVPRRAQRLSALVPPDGLDAELVARWRAAEDALYADATDPLVRWDVEDLAAAFRAEGFDTATECLTHHQSVRITPALFERWWAGAGDRPGYAARLATALSDDEVDALRRWARGRWLRQSVRWASVNALLVATRPR